MNQLKHLLPIFLSISTGFATWFDDIPREIHQPNGDVIHCFITGDQYGKRLHDINDFTIILNPHDGYYYYANLDSNGELVPSSSLAGHGNPRMMGFEPGVAISEKVYQENKLFYHNSESIRDSRDAPTSGEISQLNVFIRFSDDPEFSSPRSYYDEVFQDEEGVSSLRDYYWEISYNTLWVETYHYPENTDVFNSSYQDQHPRNYYEPYSGANPAGYNGNNERTEREHELLTNALNSIESQVPDLLDIDANDDGFVDAVSFVIYGGPGDWADLLWPHRWSLFSQNVTINGAQVWDYLFMLSESWYFNVGVLSHEFFHVLGAPDLYHYDGGGAPSPVGGWDVMEANTNPPQYPSAFMKWKYGDWLADIPEITESGTYTLNPLQLQDNAIYKIASPYSETEYFVVEYRKKEGIYDINTPGGRDGLVVYRINTNAGNGNASGPPDEIYCYRPGGTLTNNGAFELAPYSSEFGHSQLNDITDPRCFLYNDGNGADGGLNIFNVTEPGETITFSISLGTPVMEITPGELNFAMASGENESQALTFSNAGEDGTQLDFNINVSGAVPFQNPQGGPDGGNYFWTSSETEPGMDYEWIDISGNSTQLNFTHNDQFATTVIDLPFEFVFFEETYNYVQVNANGWIGWDSENETSWLNEDIPSPSAPRPAIFGFWDDMNPNNENGNATSSGDVFYHVNEDRAVIWFDDLVRWNTDDWGQFNFQIVLNADGTFQSNYQNMEGVLNSGTIGFQSETGTIGTQIVSNEEFISNEFSWKSAQSEENVSWLILSSEMGNLSGILLGGESMDIFAQVVTSGLDAGSYTANINFNSQNTNSQSVPVGLIVAGDNTTPSLPVIDISSSENGIVNLPNTVDPIFSNIASRYTHVETPNGDLIPFLIQDNFTNNQILHARKVLESYLADVPGSDWGNNKTILTNAIGASNAILFLLNDESEYENPDLGTLIDAGIKGQDLLATEVFPEGSEEYMTSSERDATYEEILHFVHGFGIQLANPTMQSTIISAMTNAMNTNLYNPLNDLPAEDYDEEYLAMGLECYFGLWAHDPNGDGFSGDQEYAFITRESMAEGDPALFGIIQGFVGETWEYKIELSESFDSDFYLNYQSDLDYTNRSQYVKKIESFGDQSMNIIGNDYSNILIGNAGDNHFTGFMGDDYLRGAEGNDRAIFQGDFIYYVVLPPFVTGDSSIHVMDMIPDRDGTNYLYDIEELEFNGVVYQVSDLLSANEQNQLPTQFALYAPYPNPFNPVTSISFDLPDFTFIELNVYNLKGEFIKSLQNGNLSPGKYSINWNAKDENGSGVPTGIYFIKFRSKSYPKTQKVLFIK